MNEEELRALETNYGTSLDAKDRLIAALVADIRHLHTERDTALYELWYLHPRYAQEKFGYVPANGHNNQQAR